MRIVDSHKGKYIEDQFIICDTYEMAVCIGILEVADKYPHLFKKGLYKLKFIHSSISKLIVETNLIVVSLFYLFKSCMKMDVLK